jgi:uncharacterized protein (TIGR02246 family)
VENALRQAVHRFVALFNTGDLEAVVAAFAEDAEYLTVTGKHCRGRAAIRAELAPQFRGVYGQLHFTLLSSAVDAAMGSASVTWTCRHTFAGAPPRAVTDKLAWLGLKTVGGRGLTWHGTDFLRFDAAAKVLRKETFFRPSFGA